MRIRRSRVHTAGVAIAATAMATVMAACGSSGSDEADSGSTAGASGGIARAEATVEKYAANPPLTVEPLAKAPDASTSAIEINCSIPACSPGGMKPAMDAIGWQFDEMRFDLAKGPADLKRAVVAAIAAKPDVILVTPAFPEETIQAEVDQAVKDGIKFILIGGKVAPNYSACIACGKSLEEMGALAADIALADAGEKTEIATAYDKTIAALLSETEGIKRAVADNGDGSKLVEVEQSVSAPPQENAARLVSFLQRNPNVKYVVASEQFLAASELKKAGLASRVKLVGINPINQSNVASVENGEVLSHSAGELISRYWRAVDAAARAVQGEPIDPIEPIQSLRVMNKSNASADLLDPADYQDVYKKAWQR